MEMVDWAKELSRSDVPAEIDRWTRVFSEHPEFFLTYVLHAQGNLKAALRWRYTNKLYDAKTGKEYTPEEKKKLPQNSAMGPDHKAAYKRRSCGLDEHGD
jgi:hypothetical protein